MIVSGKKIKEYREKRSMTKAELSKNAGVPYVDELGNGKTNTTGCFFSSPSE